MSKDTRPPSYPLRLPQELREKLERAAEQGHRPLSSEIIRRLEKSFTPDDGLALVQTLDHKISEIEGKLEALYRQLSQKGE